MLEQYKGNQRVDPADLLNFLQNFILPALGGSTIPVATAPNQVIEIARLEDLILQINGLINTTSTATGQNAQIVKLNDIFNQIVTLNSYNLSSLKKSITSTVANNPTGFYNIVTPANCTKIAVIITETAQTGASLAHSFEFKNNIGTSATVGGFTKGVDEFGNSIKHGDLAYYNALFPALAMGETIVRTFEFEVKENQFIKMRRLGASLPGLYTVNTYSYINY